MCFVGDQPLYELRKLVHRSLVFRVWLLWPRALPWTRAVRALGALWSDRECRARAKRRCGLISSCSAEIAIRPQRAVRQARASVAAARARARPRKKNTPATSHGDTAPTRRGTARGGGLDQKLEIRQRPESSKLKFKNRKNQNIKIEL